MNKESVHIHTYNGNVVYPFAMEKSVVSLEDIAHSLSMQVRYGGHCINFYSIAEHSVLMARYFIERHEYDNALYALLHDASEAYLSDINSFVKPFLNGYKELENYVSDSIYRSFGMSTDVPAVIKTIDKRILVDEMRDNMKVNPVFYVEELGIELECWPPAIAKKKFLECFDEILDMIDALERQG